MLKSHSQYWRGFSAILLLAGLAMLTATPMVQAQGKISAPVAADRGSGQVLPPSARPLGYTLADAAGATAYFNTGSREANTLPPAFPFQILYVLPAPATGNTFTVHSGTSLYVPLVFSDDTDSQYWAFPDVTNPAAVSAYYFDRKQLGIDSAKIVVDGKVTMLGPQYATGAVTPGLPSGGNNYTAIAAFLTPLSRGVHTVKVAVKASGDFFGGAIVEFEISYTVIVLF